MEPSMSKGVAILVHEDYQDLELWYPLLRLREEGKAVSVIGAEPNRTYFSRLEYPVVPDYGIDEVQARDFAAVLVPGGRSAKIIAEEPRMVRFIKEAAANGALVAAIAEGATALSAAGANATVSARSTDQLPEFCRSLFQALGR
jgi:protease I